MRKIFAVTAFAIAAAFCGMADAQQPAAPAGVKNYKFQSTWPASLTLQDNFKMFAERVDKLTEHLEGVLQRQARRPSGLELDRKSTRLNSSHSSISYAIFCLKKKT